MLDAGHYGKYNRSPVIPEYWESERMWQLHVFLKAELEKYGFIVGITRANQKKDLNVYYRGKRAESYDLLVSLHSNACDVKSVDRVCAITQVEDDRFNFDEISEEIGTKLALGVATLMKVKDGAKIYQRLYKGDRDGDGQENDNYYGILHGARMVQVPAIIIEHSFHTNKQATKWLLDDDNLKSLAKLEAEILADYYGLKPANLKGDINADGEVDSKDYILAKRAILGNIELTEEEKESADVDGDGEITPKDYILIKRAIMGTYDLDNA